MTSLTPPRAGTGAVAERGHRGRAVAACLAAAIAFAWAIGGIAPAPVSASARAAAPAAAAQQPARLMSTHTVHASARSRSPAVAVIGPWRPITGGATVLPVTAHATAADGAGWLRVMVPGRPNGRRGMDRPAWDTARLDALEARREDRQPAGDRLPRRTDRAGLPRRRRQAVDTFAARRFFLRERRVRAGGSGGRSRSRRARLGRAAGSTEGRAIGIHGVQSWGIPGPPYRMAVFAAKVAIGWLAAWIGPVFAARTNHVLTQSMLLTVPPLVHRPAAPAARPRARLAAPLRARAR